jgi:hypothetical protein
MSVRMRQQGNDMDRLGKWKARDKVREHALAGCAGARKYRCSNPWYLEPNEEA